MYANKHVYTIDERSIPIYPLWRIADVHGYRPIELYKSHRLLKRKKKMCINGYNSNRKISIFSLHDRRI